MAPRAARPAAATDDVPDAARGAARARRCSCRSVRRCSAGSAFGPRVGTSASRRRPAGAAARAPRVRRRRDRAARARGGAARADSYRERPRAHRRRRPVRARHLAVDGGLGHAELADAARARASMRRSSCAPPSPRSRPASRRSPTASCPTSCRFRTSAASTGSSAGRSRSRTRRRRGTSVVATSYGALRDVATGNYFEPRVTRRIVVLLTDGESNPFDPSQVASALARSQRLSVPRGPLLERERAGLRQRRTGRARLPARSGGRVDHQWARRRRSADARSRRARLGAAASYLRSARRARGPTVRTGATTSQQTLAPFVAGLAALLLLAAVLPVGVRVRALGGLRPASRVSGLRDASGTAARDVTRV